MKRLNNKGFTLVELLATIVILGIISVIAVVSITSIVNHSKVVECENILLSIKSAAKEYVSDKRFGFTNADLVNNKKTISVYNLREYLSSTIEDPFSNNKLDTVAEQKNIKVEITLNETDHTYESAKIKINNSDVNCSNGKTNGKVFH